MHRITPIPSLPIFNFNSPVFLSLSFLSLSPSFLFSPLFSAFYVLLGFKECDLNLTMDKGDAGTYRYSRKSGPELSSRNRYASSLNNKVQPPWKLGINSSTGSSGDSHNRIHQSHSPEKPRLPTVDSTKSVRRSSTRSLGTRPFEERQKQKRTFVGESSSSSSNIGTATGKTVTQVLTKTGDVPDFDPSMLERSIGSSSSSRFLSQRNKQINLGSSSNGTGTGMHRRGSIKSLGCTSSPDVVPSSAEGVRNRIHGEGSTRTRLLTGTAVGLNLPTPTREPLQAESRISRLLARTGETDFWASQADRTLTSSQEDQREKEEDVGGGEGEGEEEEEEEEDEEEEDEAQPSRFAFLLPHQLYGSSNRLRSDLDTRFSLGPVSNSNRDPACGLNSRMASRSGEEESGWAGHRTTHRSLRLRDREAHRRDGIAEVLLALERIEQLGELNHVEQMLILETNFLLNGLTFHDEHRDMRMDIDNMSYEELLALEEKMGTVSTALSEEEFAKCLKRSVYHESTSHSIDDLKCSICQEEYENGEEIGVLKCEHRYHVDCIHEWLRQKNWCPVCKASQNDR